MNVKSLLDIAAAHANRYLESRDSRRLRRPPRSTSCARALPGRCPRRHGSGAGHWRPRPRHRGRNSRIDERSLLRLGHGGTLPAALAADWLTSAWDQNGASNLTAPAEAVVEEVCGAWAKQLLGIPASASFAFVTGSQMAHATAFASARHSFSGRGLERREKGLAGAPQLRVLTTEIRHESIIRAVRLLGIGSDAISHVPTTIAAG